MKITLSTAQEDSGAAALPVNLQLLNGSLSAYWYESPGSNATVIPGHGYLDHGRRSLKAITAFLDSGFNVLAWDLPGHGNSQGKPGAVNDFIEYAEALDAVIAHAVETQPGDRLVFTGHSLGCAVFLTWHREIWLTGKSSCKEGSFPLEKVIFIAPLIRSWLFKLSSFGWKIGHVFLKTLKPRTGAGSHSPGYSRSFFNDPLTVKRMPVSWAASHLAWEKRSRTWKPDPLPIIVIQGSSDTAVDWRYNFRFLAAAYPSVRAEIIKGAWHCLLDEAEPYASKVYDILMHEISASQEKK